MQDLNELCVAFRWGIAAAMQLKPAFLRYSIGDTVAEFTVLAILYKQQIY